MTTTATPRRRDRAPLSSVDSNVVGSLRKKNPIRSPLGKQQKRFPTKTAKTPGTTTKRKKRRQKKKKNLTIDIETPQIESPLFKQETVLQPAQATLSDNVVVLSATTDVELSTTQLSEQISKFSFGHSGKLYNSQQWEAEQSAAFKSWLNHLFHPAPQTDAVTEEQRSAELNAAVALFRSRRMSAIRFAIEREVTEGRLAITPRADRKLLDEVYVKEQLSTLLFSYTPRWLQLGLEIVLAHHSGQRLHRQNYDMSKESLKKIILEQVLSKASAVQKYSAANVKTTSAQFEQMLRVEIQQHTLSTLLILAFFLDHAKTRQLLTEDPILFNKTSQVKSSREMLISLCQDCFAKQRSILNHLEYEGISVSHVQEPLDEYDFYVRNFAVDLKDGVCLAKMIDTVKNGSNILSSLRLPADSRKQKMYNVRLALAALRQLGVPNISDITPAHIVDAHQPRIIQLVWSTILYFELPEFRQEIIQYKASRLIQGQVRRFLAMKSFHISLQCCVSLQSLFRGVRLRRRVNEMNAAAREIQKIWRGYDAKVCYGFDLLGIITVQSVVRRFLARKRVTLLSKRIKASIQIQKIWRGYDQKIQYGFVLLDIITVQSVCRQFLDTNRANARRSGVVKIQSVARRWLTKRMVARCQNAVVTLQSFLRKSLAMKHLRELVEVDIKIDSHSGSLLRIDSDDEGEVIYYSTKQSRRRDNKVSMIRYVEPGAVCSIHEEIVESPSLEEDVASISTHSSLMSEDMELASEMERDLASMVIQIHWRRHVSSARYAVTRNAIIICQSICRKWITQKKVRNLRLAKSREDLASVKVASICRGYNARIKYMKSLAAVTMIQKIARGHKARKIVEEMKCFEIFLTWEESAKKIQAQFRRHVCETSYNTVLTGVVQLQTRIRGIHAKKTVTDLINARAQAACQIQKTYRSFYASSTFLTQKRKALIIQSVYRRHVIELKCRSAKRAAVLIQATFRSKQTRDSYLLHLKCIHILQRTARKFLADAKMKEVAATSIQRIWRGYSDNVNFKLLVIATIKIQAVTRMRSAVASYHKTLDGIILIQACFRSKLTRKSISSQQCTSIILQKVCRGFLARKHKKEQLAAIALIQRAVREKIARSLEKVQRCIIIQKALRGFLAKIHKKAQLAAVITIQRAARKMMARSLKEIRSFAAREIQRVWRGFSAHVDYMMQVMAVMKIQARYRERGARRALLTLSSQRKSSTIIQKAVRGFLARIHKKAQLAAVVTIQRAARKMMARSLKEIRSFAACEIQRVWRGFSAHVDYMMQVMGVMKIQGRYRARRARRALLTLSTLRKSSTIIQKVVRGFLARVQKKRALSAVAVIQRAAREMIVRSQDNLVRNFAACEIQRVWRGFSAHVDYMMQVMAVIRIQSSVRCFLMNTKMNKKLQLTAEMDEVVQQIDLSETGVVNETRLSSPHLTTSSKISLESPEVTTDSFPRVVNAFAYESNRKQEVNNALAIPRFITTTARIATPNKINVRSLSKYEKHTAKAIKVLRKSQLFPEVMEAVSTLEKTTSKSIDSCKLLLRAHGQDNLLSLLASCNRSSPHLELVRVILHTYTNISRHQASLSVLVGRQSLSILTDVVQMFRDKPGIFELSTSLLETFVRSDAFIISEYSSQEQRKCLRGILSLSRKRASSRSSPELDKGIASLENVICIVEGNTILDSEKKCPYCDRFFT